MKNIDKLRIVHKNHVRYSILYYGVWNGIAKYRVNNYSDYWPNIPDKTRLIHITLTNIASLNNPNLLEFYKLIS